MPGSGSSVPARLICAVPARDSSARDWHSPSPRSGTPSTRRAVAAARPSGRGVEAGRPPGRRGLVRPRGRARPLHQLHVRGGHGQPVAHDPERALDLGRAAMTEVVATAMAEWRRPDSPCRACLPSACAICGPGPGWGLVDSSGRPKAPWFALARGSATGGRAHHRRGVERAGSAPGQRLGRGHRRPRWWWAAHGGARGRAGIETRTVPARDGRRRCGRDSVRRVP